MPNGYDKNWVRLVAAVTGFHIRYGTWPVRVRMFPACLSSIQESVLSAESFAQLTAKLDLIADEVAHTAEDDEGNAYCLGTDGWPESGPDKSVAVWLGVAPDRPHDPD